MKKADRIAWTVGTIAVLTIPLSMGISGAIPMLAGVFLACLGASLLLVGYRWSKQ